MNNTFILTPFYLDQSMPGLLDLQQDKWLLNKPDLPTGDAQGRMSVLHASLADSVARAVQNGHRPVSIAGDCCTAIGVLAGLQRCGISPRLIWLDAHGDFNTWETTPSGFLGGMPLAMLVGRGEQRMPRWVGLANIHEEDVTITDARDLDPEEGIQLAGSRIHHLKSVTDLLNYDPGESPLYIHFDTDVISPDDAPAMNYPTPGGPAAHILAGVFKHLAKTYPIAAVSLSSWNPELDLDGRTGKACMGVLEALL